jgi:hypothetical protein
MHFSRHPRQIGHARARCTACNVAFRQGAQNGINLVDGEFAFILRSEVPKEIPGDLDGDGDVDFDDIGIAVAYFGQPASCDPRADVIADGVINILDVSVVGSNFTGP